MVKLQPHELDSLDRAILNLLQVDNTTPLRVIGEQVHLSTAPTQRRIRRLRERGVIQANAAVVDPESVGQPITILVEVQAERTHGADLDAMKAELSGPEVQQCYYVTGNFDFLLVLTVPNMAEYEVIARRLFYENRNVKCFQTVIVMDRVKVGLRVPIAARNAP
jgi:DNA-binding Lrp family transcriptional regulator